MDINKLIGVIPDEAFEQLQGIIGKYNINSSLRLAHFISQCSHESMEFKATKENLNYSADALTKLFGKYFVGVDVNDYARQPEKIANRIYADRMGNGDEESGDGYKYRGRGYLQSTGKNNYTQLASDLKIDCVNNPDLISDQYPMESAALFFTKNGLWSICDKGSDILTITALTKRINGGVIGLNDRILQFNKFYELLK